MIGLGFAYSNMMTTGMSLLEEKDFGDGNTLFNTLQQFSGAIATAIVATIINIAQDHADNFAQGTTMGSLISLIFLLTLLVIVLIACWNYFRKKLKSTGQFHSNQSLFSFLKIVVFVLLASEYKVRTRQQLAR